MLQERVADQVRPVATATAGVDVAVDRHVRTRHWIDEEAGLELVRVTTAGSPDVLVTLEAPLGGAVGFWHPDARFVRSLRADYEGSSDTSLTSSTPMGCVYDAEGNSVLAFALDRLVGNVSMRFGVSEERKTFVVHLMFAAEGAEEVSLAIAKPGVHLDTAIARLGDWQRAGVADGPLVAPFFATRPVYSTWYAFAQEVDADSVEAEARMAADLGFGSIFIDDGWQRLASGRGYSGCGDWIADEQKFPDLAAHVDRLHALGLRVVLWLAPLYLGDRSQSYSRLRRFATAERPGHAAVLDPRHPEVRRHLTALCLRLMTEYGVDGLKIDFLEDAALYSGTATTGDIEEPGRAMAAWLGELRDTLAMHGFEQPLIEFREPYVSPALIPYGNVLRAGDCPADPVANRTSILDLRKVAGQRVVHSDMIMWDPTGPATAVTNQLYATALAVPQVSMRLTTLPREHLRIIARYCRLWSSLSDVVLYGRVEAGLPVDHYPYAAVRHPDGRAVVALYQSAVVRLPGRLDGDLLLLNSTGSDEVVVDRGADAAPIRVVTYDPEGVLSGDDLLDVEGVARLIVPRGGTALLVSEG